jgi:ADP-heptose:LPS heptosyltransferase
MANILVIRLSAIGDVVMTIPVIYSAARANPGDKFTVLTQIFLMPVFINRPSNVDIIGINTKGSEKSLWGLLRFARAYAKYDFDLVFDLQEGVRSRIIDLLFRMRGKKVFMVNKARKDRSRLTSRSPKVLKPLRPVIDRYHDVFKAAGMNFADTFHSLFDEKHPASIAAIEDLSGPKEGKWIGIAPFAKHPGKIYPVEKMEQVVATFSRRKDVTIFLLGGRGEEQEVLEIWARKYPRVKNVAGKYSLDKELSLITYLDLLVCMDSANMHFASLVGTTVISIWGSTHPYAGFYGYRQLPENAIQLDLDCRPCSIYGNKPCHRGDWACLKQLPPSLIISKVEEVLCLK